MKQFEQRINWIVFGSNRMDGTRHCRKARFNANGWASDSDSVRLMNLQVKTQSGNRRKPIHQPLMMVLDRQD